MPLALKNILRTTYKKNYEHWDSKEITRYFYEKDSTCYH